MLYFKKVVIILRWNTKPANFWLGVQYPLKGFEPRNYWVLDLSQFAKCMQYVLPKSLILSKEIINIQLRWPYCRSKKFRFLLKSVIL